MTKDWHYAEGEKTVGPLDLKEMQSVLSEISDPRNLRVWKPGFKDWERAGNVPELAELIHKPPPLPQAPKSGRKQLASQEVWRSAAAIGVSVVVMVAVSGIGAALAGIPLLGRPRLGNAAATTVRCYGKGTAGTLIPVPALGGKSWPPFIAAVRGAYDAPARFFVNTTSGSGCDCG
jgi:GYF domain 2